MNVREAIAYESSLQGEWKPTVGLILLWCAKVELLGCKYPEVGTKTREQWTDDPECWVIKEFWDDQIDSLYV